MTGRAHAANRALPLGGVAMALAGATPLLVLFGGHLLTAGLALLGALVAGVAALVAGLRERRDPRMEKQAKAGAVLGGIAATAALGFAAFAAWFIWALAHGGWLTW